MDFFWSSKESTFTEKNIWQSLELTLASEEGVCYHRFPIFWADRSKREPDILVFHRYWGLYIFDCKEFRIENIEKINGQVWEMSNWQSSQEIPISQAEDKMLAVLGKFRVESNLRKNRKDLIQGHILIGLPYIKRSEWISKGFEFPTDATIIFEDDVETGQLAARLKEVSIKERQEPLTKEQWDLALSILQCGPVLRRQLRPEPSNHKSKAYMIREVEQQMMIIDKEQTKVAVQVPDGPQRIRGLSGSGKTVIMCMKAACMHLRYPEWDIAYTFYTRSLYGMIRNLITRFYRYWVDQDPDWDKIHIVHGWGAKDTPGLYGMVARKMGKSPRTYFEARNLFSFKQQHELLGKCCEELINSGEELPELFDTVLIDEGQDFNFNFYRLCYNILKNPKRLIWAYDEVQSLESLSIPTSIEIFGTNSDGSPIIDLDGAYSDGKIEKDIILYHCYRTPRPVLVVAHMFGMGLLRQQGAVQFIPTRGGWEDIGYEIVSGSFQPGQKLSIRRPQINSPHILEQLVGSKNLIQCKTFTDRDKELAWIVDQISANINQDELRPDDILVISLDWKSSRTDLLKLRLMLQERKIEAIRPGYDGIGSDEFQRKDNVTLSSIWPAKGNEASIVYVMGFEQVGENPRLIVQERNQAFTAMTRTRGWCFLTGVGATAESLFKEIESILDNLENVTFTVPDPTTIKRNLDNLENERLRRRIRTADELTNKLRQVLLEINDPKLRKSIIEKLNR